jgi:hypothetical protein
MILYLPEVNLNTQKAFYIKYEQVNMILNIRDALQEI